MPAMPMAAAMARHTNSATPWSLRSGEAKFRHAIPPWRRHGRYLTTLPYVSGILRHLKSLLDGERARSYLSPEVKSKLLSGAATEITGRYYALASDLVNVARKTESSLQRIRQGAQRRAGASSEVSDNNVSDTDKVCMQLFLDIQEYGRNLSSLGVEAADIPAYRSLWQCVAPRDRQNTIVY